MDNTPKRKKLYATKTGEYEICAYKIIKFRRNHYMGQKGVGLKKTPDKNGRKEKYNHK